MRGTREVALLLAVMLLAGCASPDTANPNVYKLHHWDDSTAGVRCYRVFGLTGVSCVKVR